MIDNNFTKEELYPLFALINGSKVQVGTDTVTYKIFKIIDTRNLTLSNTYSIVVKHRIKIEGVGWGLNGAYQSEGFNNYPIMLSVQSGISAISNSPIELVLKKIFPKTINASVEQSSNQSTGASTSQTNQVSNGSSTSNVNTFGVDMSIGFFDEVPVGSFGVNYSHSSDSAHSHSHSSGHSRSSDTNATSGNEMSVKDWSAYSCIQNLDKANKEFTGEVIQWMWGQSYPWNIFDFNEPGSNSSILLTDDVAARLLYSPSNAAPGSGGSILMPPSDLSLFGVDFTMAAEWQVTFPTLLTSVEEITFQHNVEVQLASHVMNSGGANTTLQATLSLPYVNQLEQTTPMDIGEYALIPLLDGQRNGVGISFQSNLFDIVPSSPSVNFKIRSRGNDLLVTGSGFSEGISATFPGSGVQTSPTLSVMFKVVNLQSQYSLILKHWIGPASGPIVATCTINGNVTIINITDTEGQGASNNINQIDLRNYDISSPNFHDYLLLGWNEISLQIAPLNSTQQSEYTLAALSVEG